jgi:hypothetical protein
MDINGIRAMQRSWQTPITQPMGDGVFRIGDRDSLTGNYDAIYPDGSAAQGVKIFNSKHETGDAVLAFERSDGLFVLESDKSVEDESEEAWIPEERRDGYLRGQIWNRDEEEIDRLPKVSIVASVSQVNEGGAFAFLIKLDRAPKREIEIEFAIHSKAADTLSYNYPIILPGNYQVSVSAPDTVTRQGNTTYKRHGWISDRGVIKFPKGTKTRTVSVQTFTDLRKEPTEIVEIKIVLPEGTRAKLADPDVDFARVSVLDTLVMPTAIPTVRLAGIQGFPGNNPGELVVQNLLPEASSGTALIFFRLNFPPPIDLVVYYSLGGEATPNYGNQYGDYEFYGGYSFGFSSSYYYFSAVYDRPLTSEFLIIPAGANQGLLAMQSINDSIPESNESLTISLLSGFGYTPQPGVGTMFVVSNE